MTNDEQCHFYIWWNRLWYSKMSGAWKYSRYSPSKINENTLVFHVKYIWLRSTFSPTHERTFEFFQFFKMCLSSEKIHFQMWLDHSQYSFTILWSLCNAFSYWGSRKNITFRKSENPYTNRLDESRMSSIKEMLSNVLQSTSPRRSSVNKPLCSLYLLSTFPSYS